MYHIIRGKYYDRKLLTQRHLSDNGCQDHYDPSGDMCIRPSAYSETYDDAQSKCKVEGGSLLSVTSVEIQVGLL